MSVAFVSARVHADNADAVAQEAHQTFAAIAADRPDAGIALYQLTDGVTFVAVLDLPGERNPLTAIPAFVEFQKSLSAWGAAPPRSAVAKVVEAPLTSSG